MGKVNDAYDANYGINARVVLRIFGGDPDTIIREREARVGETYCDMMHWVDGKPAEIALTADDLAQDAHREIVKAIRAAFFGQMSRQQAEGTLATLSAFPAATLTLCNDLTYNDLTFADGWSEAHPDEPRLYVHDEYFA